MKAIAIFFASVLTTLVLPGCSTFTRAGESWPAALKACTGNPCTQAEAQAMVSATIQYCREMIGYYERSGRLSNTASLGVGIVGALAGAVFAPIAAGSAAVAWSGLSGATNGIQTQINGASIGDTKTQSEAVQAALKEYTGKIVGAKDTNTLATEALAYAGKCAAAK